MKKIYFLAAVTLAMAACDNDDNNSVITSEAVKITATIGERVLSRASDASWAAGDTIGISTTVATEKGPFNNLKYTTAAGDGKFTGTPLYFYKPMVLTAYYPFTGAEGTRPGILEAKTEAGNQTSTEQPKIDFLWDSQAGITVSDPNVNFTFAHKMSKLTFVFKESEKAKAEHIVGYEIEGLKLDGTFDTETGVCAVKNDVAQKKLKIDLEKGSVESEKALAPLIVFPQTAVDAVKLHLYLDEINNKDYIQTYTCTLILAGDELKPGHHYKYIVQMTKAALKVGVMSVEDWDNAPDVNITATLDGEPIWEDNNDDN